MLPRPPLARKAGGGDRGRFQLPASCHSAYLVVKEAEAIGIEFERHGQMLVAMDPDLPSDTPRLLRPCDRRRQLHDQGVSVSACGNHHERAVKSMLRFNFDDREAKLREAKPAVAHDVSGRKGGAASNPGLAASNYLVEGYRARGRHGEWRLTVHRLGHEVQRAVSHAPDLPMFTGRGGAG